jgi:hypothetical protein
MTKIRMLSGFSVEEKELAKNSINKIRLFWMRIFCHISSFEDWCEKEVPNLFSKSDLTQYPELLPQKFR